MLHLAKRFNRSLIAAVAGLAAVAAGPAVAFAATVTVTDPITVVLPSDGSTYTVGPTSGNSTGSLDQLDVSGGTMTFTMSSGESVLLTASSNLALTNDKGYAYTCAANSTLALSAGSSIVVNVTPSGSCTISSSGSGGGGGGGGSTGGGGSVASTVSTTVTATTTPATTATTTAQTTTTTAAPATPAMRAATASGLSITQIQSILDVLASFNADASIIAKVKVSLEGTGSGAAVSAAAAYGFKQDLAAGSIGAGVKELQKYLNTHGFPVTMKGPGSKDNETMRFGELTRVALAKLQRAAGITPANGFLGPKTRAYISAHP